MRVEREHRAYGSVPVRVTLGGSTWDTSLFADRKSASYVLPVKAAIRRAERIADGDEIEVALRSRS